ncbi:ABC transporter permease [Rhizosphaericola mali]|nr:ABC transporter permease [Rhizosphaericola mali]
MRKKLAIIWNSFLMALQELKVNKLRTFLSLFGITIGIFCIIGVMALVDSLKQKIKSDIDALGTNTIFIDKWEYLNSSDYPWWKFVNRPAVKYSELKLLQERTTLASNICFMDNQTVNLHYKNFQYSNVSVNGVSEDFSVIQKLKIGYGRYLNRNEFERGSSVGVVGYEVASQLFGVAQAAVGKAINVEGKRINIIGVLEKQGKSIAQFFDYDNSVILGYYCYANIFNINNNNSSPVLIVMAKPGVSNTALVDELRGAMRQVRRLSPRQSDNFALNDINVLSNNTDSIFSAINWGGIFIAGLSLVVGVFGVANIMFVTVKERTGQIGLKKALGAKSGSILTEFLIESAFLCSLGGAIGLLLVFILSLILSAFLPFPIFIAGHIIVIAFTICIVFGILAGIIPAMQAARLNPVTAIRK